MGHRPFFRFVEQLKFCERRGNVEVAVCLMRRAEKGLTSPKEIMAGAPWLERVLDRQNRRRNARIVWTAGGP